MRNTKLLYALQEILNYLADDLREYEIRRCEGIYLENHIGESLLIVLRYLREFSYGEFDTCSK